MRRVLQVCGAVLLGLAAGCAAPLQVGPFTEATVEVRSAVVTAGSTVEAELRSMEGGADYAARFQEQWGTRVRAMDALVSYTNSLQALTAAGEEGAKSVSAVADGVSQLAQAAGIALPAAGTVAVATDTAKFVYQQVALARAARSLAEALLSAQPAVEEIARQIAQDLAAASEIFEAANVAAELALTDQYNKELGFRTDLLAEQREIYGKGARNLSAADRQRLLEIDQLLTSTNPWFEPWQAQQAQLQERRRVGSALFAAALDGVGQWGVAHYNLVVAVQERRPVDTASLVQAVMEIRDLIRRMREL